MKKTNWTYKRILFSPKPRTEQHFIWVSELVSGTRYLAYLPFQNYGCQVLIRVIRVKNVISFQGYFEQISLISFFKKRTHEGGADCMEQTRFLSPGKPSHLAWAQRTKGYCSSAFLPSSHRVLEISFSQHLLLLLYCHPMAITTALNLAKSKGSGESI